MPQAGQDGARDVMVKVQADTQQVPRCRLAA
jgi:hypothetical protein